MNFLEKELQFQWDLGNINKNEKKHGISVNEIEECFFNYSYLLFDTKHSNAEIRFNLIGRTNLKKILFIAFTVRQPYIRVVSARLASQNERSIYEKSQEI